MKKIEYVVEDTCTVAAIRGMKLTGGIPHTENGINTVRFAEKSGGKTICLKIATRPSLSALVSEYEKGISDEKEEEKRKESQEIEDIIAGKTLIKPAWHDGEYLSGYQVFGKAGDVLEKIGIAEYIPGWGRIIDQKVIDTIGEVFSYEDAVAYLRPAMEEKERKNKEKQAELAVKFEEAKKTGKPVMIASWMEDCNDKSEECSTDYVTKYAMPDGSAKISRQHTW